MGKEDENVRRQVVGTVELFASPSEQRKYESDVPIACVPDELVCFANDLFNPKWQPFVDAFSADELKSLAELYGRVCIASKAFDRDNLTVSAIQKLKEWREVISFAKDLAVELKRNG
jgi:hypothetical protein